MTKEEFTKRIESINNVPAEVSKMIEYINIAFPRNTGVSYDRSSGYYHYEIHLSFRDKTDDDVQSALKELMNDEATCCLVYG